MIVAGRARTQITEVDLSDRVPSFPGIYGCMVLDTQKGYVRPFLVTSEADFLKRYTLYEKVQVGESLSMFEALYYLQKNNKLWVIRPETGALHGACLLTQDKPFNNVSVTFNSALYTVNLRAVTEAEQEIARVCWSSIITGEVMRFDSSSNSSLPNGIIPGSKYYLIPYDESRYAYRIATTYENAIEGNYVEFSGDFDGLIQMSFGNDLVNTETNGVKIPDQYLLDTSDGKPAGINSTFTVDTDNDQVNVDCNFYNSCRTGDEMEIRGTVPTVATGFQVNSGDIVYVIKVAQEGVNADKCKIQLARSEYDARAGNFVNFLEGGNFTLSFTNKSNTETVASTSLDIVNDTITCSNKFWSLCQTNDKVRFSLPASNGEMPKVAGDKLETDAIYYIIKGSSNNLIQIARERNGIAINFTSDIDLANSFILTLAEKPTRTSATVDLSNDTINVSETFYEFAETGHSCIVTSDGNLPSGLSSTKTYYIIKTKKNKLIMLASTKENAELGVPVDIIGAGSIDSEMGEYHTITNTNNSVLNGFSQYCMLVYTKTPTPEPIFITIQHYPYGDESSWTEADKLVARSLVEPYSFKLNVFKRWEDGTYTQEESWLMSRKKDAMDGTQTNIYCEEVAKRSSYIDIINNENISEEVYPCNQVALLKLAGGTAGNTATTGDMMLALDQIANKRRYSCNLIMDGGYSVPAYQKEIIAVAESRQYTVGILSTPLSLELSSNYLEDLLEYRNTTLNSNTSYAAIYSPHLKVYDKYNNREIYISPTGHVGGLISQTGENQELWYPVAGNRRGVLDVLGLSRIFEDADEDELYNDGINPIDFSLSRGIRVWGQKTLYRRNSALDRMNVRLLLVVIEPAIQEFLDDFLFEINDELTRGLIVSGISSYMDGIQSRRGVYAYNVICDESNNTAEDVDNYLLNVYLFIQPTKSIEYIECKVIITRTGASFSVEMGN